MNRTHNREAMFVAKQKKRTFAVPAILAAGSLWGSMGLFVRVYNARGLQSMDIVAIRAMATVIAMFVFMIFFRRELLRIRLRDLWCFLGTGIGSIVLFQDDFPDLHVGGSRASLYGTSDCHGSVTYPFW